MLYSAIENSLSNIPRRPRSLIVNPDLLIRELYTHLLNLDGYPIESVSDGADAEWLAMEEFDVVAALTAIRGRVR